jgi:diaminohydroxyphosphoribosylaminopyrimidine deaminase / 5-amino-6-(5-phosphoribosylamino)uracil reductase
MNTHEKYMQRCLELAARGLGHVSPNPMVGAVIVHNDVIIGEGFHEVYGGPHAEVNAIASVDDEQLLSDSTLYISLEPCVHQGKTPPCTDLILEKKIPRVVFACFDPNPLVSGKGMTRLVQAGVDVNAGVSEAAALQRNKRFITFFEQKRPYIILKWAQTDDGFIDHEREEMGGQRAMVSGEEAQRLVHQWRGEEQAICVGTNTVIEDNPLLTVRLGEGKNPLRITFDRQGRISSDANIFNEEADTLIFSEGIALKNKHSEFIPIDFEHKPLQQMMQILAERKIQSVLVEGGAKLLQSFIDQGLWDEARIFYAPEKFESGIKAPEFSERAVEELPIGKDTLRIYYRHV